MSDRAGTHGWVNSQSSGLRARIAGALPPRRRATDQPENDDDLRADGIASANDDVTEKGEPLLLTLNDEMNRRLDRQWDTITQLDTKAGLLLTFEIAAAGVLLSQGHTASGYVALAGFAVAIILTLTCLAVRSWSNAPAPDVLVQFEEVDPARTYDRLVRAKAKSYLHNEEGLVRKADWLKLTTWWLAAPIVSTAVSFLG